MRIALVLLAAVLLPCGPALAADDAPVLWPDVKAGDRWTYRLVDSQSTRIYEMKVTFVGQDAIQALSVVRGSGEEIDTTWTRDWNAVTDRLTGSFFPDNAVLRFPLKPGLRYTAEYEVARPRARESFRAKNSLQVSVLGWEKISVAAGTFRALKIEATGTYRRLDAPRSGTVRVAVWYVPEVRRWVKRTFENWRRNGAPLRRESHELLEYHLH